MVTFTTKHLEEYKLHLAAERLYHYTWNEFADVIIESQKEVLNGPDCPEKDSAQWTMRYIWQSLPERKQPLIVSTWPKS